MIISALHRDDSRIGSMTGRCRVIEGIEAEVVAIIFVVQLLSKLSKLSFYVLPAQQDGACAQGSGRR